MADLSDNVLVKPPFAGDPPLKWNVPARTLGLIFGVLGLIWVLIALIALIGLLGICASLGASICSSIPIVPVLGTLLSFVGLATATYGAWRMYSLDRRGRDLVVYGVALGAVGSLVNLLGTLLFYAGLVDYQGAPTAGAVAGFVIGVAIDLGVYYLVIISRFPDEPPLVPGPFAGPPPDLGPPPSFGSPAAYGGPPPSYETRPPESPPPPPPPSP